MWWLSILVRGVLLGIAIPMVLALLVFVALIASITLEGPRHRAEMFAAYYELLPKELRGGTLLRSQRLGPDYRICAAEVRDISMFAVEDIFARYSTSIAPDTTDKNSYKYKGGWLLSPPPEAAKITLSAHVCLSESDRAAVAALLEQAGNLAFVRNGRTGFGNWDTGPRTYFQYLIVLDVRNKRLYSSFWDQDWGG